MTNVYDISQWYDPMGAVILFGTIGLILLWCIVKLMTPRWSDWLDERWGRGSIRDPWLLSEIEQEARRNSSGTGRPPDAHRSA